MGSDHPDVPELAIRKILFPTDGSPLAERALALAAAIAASQQAEILLVRITAPPVWLNMDAGNGPEGRAELYQQVMDSVDTEARQELSRIVHDLATRAIPIAASSALLQGVSYAALLDYEAEMKPDLVVMATHGRTGLARFALGSVTDAMVREGTAPVLLVRSFGREVPSLESALVPLDGSALAEQALPMVESLAEKPLRQVRLLRIVATHAEHAAAQSYLAQVGTRLSSSDLQVEIDVRVGTPGEVITKLADQADVVIMATHGRGGLTRFRHGSVAEQLLRDIPVPLLLVRATAP